MTALPFRGIECNNNHDPLWQQLLLNVIDMFWGGLIWVVNYIIRKYNAMPLPISCALYSAHAWLIRARETTLIMSQCTLTGPAYTEMPLECHWLTQCTLGYHWAIQRILAGYTGTPLEKLSWNSPTLECHWRKLIETVPHWDATGEALAFAAYTGIPLEGR